MVTASSTYDLPGQKKPNAWGFYDMHGNVLEWTLDQHVDNRLKHFGNKAQKDPWVIATKAYPHVTKGGYWQQDIEAISSAARHPSSLIGRPLTRKARKVSGIIPTRHGLVCGWCGQ